MVCDNKRVFFFPKSQNPFYLPIYFLFVYYMSMTNSAVNQVIYIGFKNQSCSIMHSPFAYHNSSTCVSTLNQVSSVCISSCLYDKTLSEQ